MPCHAMPIHHSPLPQPPPHPSPRPQHSPKPGQQAGIQPGRSQAQEGLEGAAPGGGTLQDPRALTCRDRAKQRGQGGWWLGQTVTQRSRFGGHRPQEASREVPGGGMGTGPCWGGCGRSPQPSSHRGAVGSNSLIRGTTLVPGHCPQCPHLSHCSQHPQLPHAQKCWKFAFSPHSSPPFTCT